MPKKTNPRRVIVRSEDQKTAIRRETMKRCWAKMFTVLVDKHGWDNNRLGEFWEAVNAVSYLMIGEKPELSIGKVIKELLADGIDTRKVFIGSQNTVENVRKSFESTATTIMLYTLKHKMEFDAEDLRQIWEEYKNYDDSLRNGYVSVQDLVDTLAEEADVRLYS